MWRLLLAAAVISAGSAHAQNMTVFGSSDAYECYQSTTLFGGGADALDQCNKALKFGNLSRSDRAKTLVNRGINLTAESLYDQALADFEEALQLMPDLAEAFVNRGNTFIFKNQFRRAIEEYDRGLELGTKDPHAAYYNRGLAHEALRELDNAFADFLKADGIRPNWRFAVERIERYEANGYQRTN
jgi:tetratricopeptide (TPR) repeat protein